MQFWKMNGAGNDFIVIDNRHERLTTSQLSALARHVCRHHFSVGADGLMAVCEPERGGDFRMLFFNSDGSIGEMCGNGARCICRYGFETGLTGETQTIETTAGIVTGQRIDAHQYRIRLNNPTEIQLDLSLEIPGGQRRLSYIALGDPAIPHAVVEYPNLRNTSFDSLRELGRILRHHPAFPKGANVNFYEIVGQDHLVEKTFERGVEDFTYACGTGTGSVVTALSLQGRVSGKNVRVDVPGGSLFVDVLYNSSRVTDLYLTGPTNIVYRAELTDEELSGLF